MIMKDSFFALGLTEHRLWGLVLLPLKLNRSQGKSFFRVDYTIFPRDLDTTYQSLSYTEKETVKIIDEYNDKKLFSLFSKEKTLKEFHEKVQKEKINKFIRPYIEKRLYRIFELINNTSIKVFIRDKNRSNIFEEDFLTIMPGLALPVFTFTKSETESSYFLQLKYNQKIIDIKDQHSDIITNSPALIKLNEKLYFVKDIEGTKINVFFGRDVITIPQQSALNYFKKFVLNIVQQYEVNANGFSIKEIHPEKSALVSLERGLDNNIVLVLQFIYNKKRIFPNSNQICFVDFKLQNEDYIFYKFYRDEEFENTYHDVLSDLGLISFDQVNYELSGNRKLSFADQLYAMIEWLNLNNQKLIDHHLIFSLKEEFSSYFTGGINLTIDSNLVNDWFDIYAVIKIGEFELTLNKLRKNILNNQREYKLPDGLIFVIPIEWFSRFKEMFDFGKINDEKIQVHKQHFFIIEKAKQGSKERILNELSILNEKENLPQAFLPEGITTTLRPYQIEGFKWLWYLQQNNLGGCLADDMGLGKTIQAIAILQKNKEDLLVNADEQKIQQKDLFSSTEKPSPTSIIIVPASLVYNWRNEILRFAPSLKVYSHIGNQREKSLNMFLSYDIIISSYHTVRQDIELLLNFNFHYIVLDESQVIKNPSSKIYKAVNILNSKYKLALTGTPIENSLTDLWAQMNFINKGLLGSLSYFKQSFVLPIEKKNQSQYEEKLKRLINPFILRRKKEQVAKDLPSLNEQVIYCGMSDDQRKFYEQEKSGIRNAIFERIEKEGAEKSAIIVLQGLTRLRQISNHPGLVDENYKGDSGKFDEVLRNIDNVISEGHKVLIFSSFVRHLKLFSDVLEKEKIQYSILTGTSRNREEIVNNFQSNEDCKVFLISLKAGGVGLNLTAADYVFIIDPWWNPASEDQALNRAHRIGQNKNVFVYRFISEKSIEEKIKILQEKKSKLAQTFVHANNPMAEIGEEELTELFA
jgi:SNF2 family DNA or RNA helicase